jgi:hypothetical protein
MKHLLIVLCLGLALAVHASARVVLPVVMLPDLASEVYDSEIGSILQDVSSANRMVRLNATNRIDTLMTSLSNREEIATCKLLMAKLRMECADITGDESIYDFHAYNDVTNLCWSVLHDFDADRAAWPFYGASLLLPLPLSMDKNMAICFPWQRMRFSQLTHKMES